MPRAEGTTAQAVRKKKKRTPPPVARTLSPSRAVGAVGTALTLPQHKGLPAGFRAPLPVRTGLEAVTAPPKRAPSKQQKAERAAVKHALSLTPRERVGAYQGGFLTAEAIRSYEEYKDAKSELARRTRAERELAIPQLGAAAGVARLPPDDYSLRDKLTGKRTRDLAEGIGRFLIPAPSPGEDEGWDWSGRDLAGRYGRVAKAVGPAVGKAAFRAVFPGQPVRPKMEDSTYTFDDIGKLAWESVYGKPVGPAEQHRYQVDAASIARRAAKLGPAKRAELAQRVQLIGAEAERFRQEELHNMAQQLQVGELSKPFTGMGAPNVAMAALEASQFLPQGAIMHGAAVALRPSVVRAGIEASVEASRLGLKGAKATKHVRDAIDLAAGRPRIPYAKIQAAIRAPTIKSNARKAAHAAIDDLSPSPTIAKVIKDNLDVHAHEAAMAAEEGPARKAAAEGVYMESLASLPERPVGDFTYAPTPEQQAKNLASFLRPANLGKGGADNVRLDSQHGVFAGHQVSGEELTPEQWVERQIIALRYDPATDTMMSAADIAAGKDVELGLKLAFWYRELGPLFHAHFGDAEVDAIIRGFAVSQANASPAGGLGAVLKVRDKIIRGEEITKGEISTVVKSIEAAIKGDPVEEGMQAKLTDFTDAVIGRRRRTWVGGDVRGMTPAPIDIHSMRDIGYIDAKILDTLRERHGLPVAHLQLAKMERELRLLRNEKYKPKSTVSEKVWEEKKARKIIAAERKIEKFKRTDKAAIDEGLASGIRIDSDGSPGTRQLHSSVRKYHEITDHLNREDVAFLGRTDWEASEVQALGWSTIQRVHGTVPEDAMFALNRNTSDIRLDLFAGETALGEGLSISAQRAIATEIAEGLLPRIAEAENLIMRGEPQVMVVGRGADRTVGIQMRVFAGDDQVQRTVERLARISPKHDARAVRSGVTVSKREGNVGEGHAAFELVSRGFEDETQASLFFDRLQELAPPALRKHITGYTLANRDGELVMQIISGNRPVAAKGSKAWGAKYGKVVDEVLDDEELGWTDDVDYYHTNVEVRTSQAGGKAKGAVRRPRRVAELGDPLDAEASAFVEDAISRHRGRKGEVRRLGSKLAEEEGAVGMPPVGRRRGRPTATQGQITLFDDESEQLAREAEVAADNPVETRSLDFETTLGSEMFGDDLSIMQTRLVNRALEPDIVELIEATPGIEFIGMRHAIGGWAQGNNASMHATVRGTREAITELASRLARALDQELVQASREATTADARASVSIASPAFNDDAATTAFFRTLNKHDETLDGYIVDDIDGVPAITIQTSNPALRSEAEGQAFLEQYAEAIAKTEQELGIEVGYKDKNIELVIGGKGGKEAGVESGAIQRKGRVAVEPVDDPHAAQVQARLADLIEQARRGELEGDPALDPGLVPRLIPAAEAREMRPRPGYVYHGTNLTAAQRILEEQRVAVGRERAPEAAWFSTNPAGAAFNGPFVVELPEVALPANAQRVALGNISAPQDVRWPFTSRAVDDVAFDTSPVPDEVLHHGSPGGEFDKVDTLYHTQMWREGQGFYLTSSKPKAVKYARGRTATGSRKVAATAKGAVMSFRIKEGTKILDVDAAPTSFWQDMVSELVGEPVTDELWNQWARDIPTGKMSEGVANRTRATYLLTDWAGEPKTDAFYAIEEKLDEYGVQATLHHENGVPVYIVKDGDALEHVGAEVIPEAAISQTLLDPLSQEVLAILADVNIPEAAEASDLLLGAEDTSNIAAFLEGALLRYRKEKGLYPKDEAALEQAIAKIERLGEAEVAGEPSVPEGHVRLYRGEPEGALSLEEQGLVPGEETHYFTTDREFAAAHGEVRYVDIPREEASAYSAGAGTYELPGTIAAGAKRAGTTTAEAAPELPPSLQGPKSGELYEPDVEWEKPAEGGPPAPPGGTPPPAPPGGVPTPPPEPQGLPEARQIVREAIPGGKGTLALQEHARSVEKGIRASEVDRIFERTDIDGEEKRILALHALKGKLPVFKFRGFSELTPEGLAAIYLHLADHTQLTTWEKVRAMGAVESALHGVVPTRSNMILLEKAFGPGIRQTMRETATLSDKLKHLGPELWNLPRALMSTLDMSAPFRQALVFGTSHPILFFRNFKAMAQSTGSKKTYERYMNDIMESDTYPLMLRHGTQFTDIGGAGTREELFQSNLAEHRYSPVGPLVRGSSRAFTAFLNKSRADLWNHLYQESIDSGAFYRMHKSKGFARAGRKADDYKGSREHFLDSLSSLVNASTGRGDARSLERFLPAMNALMFSPRLLMSRLNFMNPFYYASLHPAMRREALYSTARLLGTNATILAGLKASGLADVELDPRNADWGKIRIGDTRIDIFGGFQQPLRTMAQVVSGKVISSTTGKELTLGPAGPGDLSKRDIIQRFAESKLNPSAAFINEWLKGSAFDGQPFEIKKAAIQRMLPLLAQDSYDLWVRTHDPAFLTMIATLGFFGVGTQTYSKKSSGRGRKPPPTPSLGSRPSGLGTGLGQSGGGLGSSSGGLGG